MSKLAEINPQSAPCAGRTAMPPTVVILARRSPDQKSWGRQITCCPTVPSRWPKGQTIMDRCYWLDRALLALGNQARQVGWTNMTPNRLRSFNAQERRLHGLYDQALGLMDRS